MPFSHILVDEDGIGGGVVDHLPGVKGFIANSPPVEDAEGNKPPYQHLKSQCTYLLADKVNRHDIAITTQDMEMRQEIIDELEQIKSRDADKDGKLKVLQKEDIIEILGRSPDYADMLMMRMFFELEEPEAVHVAKQWKPVFKRAA